MARETERAKPRSVQRVVSRRPLTSTEVVQEIMFLLGVEYVAKRKYDKAVQMVRHIWHDGYAIGVEMQNRKPATLKKIKAILSGKEKAANDPSSATGADKKGGAQ